MADGLDVKDGNGTLRTLQVNTVEGGKLVQNHTIVSTVVSSNVTLFYKDGNPGWSFDQDYWNPDPVTDPHNFTTQIVELAALDTLGTRKSIIIQNNSTETKCYIIVGGSDINFGDFTDLDPSISSPPKYSFMLDAGATYFGDYATATLKHLLFVPRAYEYYEKDSFTVAVTEVY